MTHSKNIAIYSFPTVILAIDGFRLTGRYSIFRDNSRMGRPCDDICDEMQIGLHFL